MVSKNNLRHARTIKVSYPHDRAEGIAAWAKFPVKGNGAVEVQDIPRVVLVTGSVIRSFGQFTAEMGI